MNNPSQPLKTMSELMLMGVFDAAEYAATLTQEEKHSILKQWANTQELAKSTREELLARTQQALDVMADETRWTKNLDLLTDIVRNDDAWEDKAKSTGGSNDQE